MERSNARSRFAIAVVLIGAVGASFIHLVDQYDGPLFWWLGVVIGGIALESILFASAPPPRGFPIEPITRESDPGLDSESSRGNVRRYAESQMKHCPFD